MKKLHTPTLCEALSASYLTLVIAYYIFTKKYIMYVVPRMVPFLYIFLITVAAWALVSWYRMYRKQYQVSYKKCAIFLIPAFLLTFPPPIVTPYGAYAEGAPQKPYHITDHNLLAYQIQQQEEREKTESVLPSGINQFQKTIILTDKNFYRTLLQIGTSPQKYNGYKLIVTGYVSHIDNTLPNNYFIMARTVMACCIADVAPMGVPSVMKNGKPQQDGKWMTVEGTLSTEHIAGRDQPVLTITKVESAQPIPGYVYP